MKRTLLVLLGLLVVTVIAYTQQIPTASQGTRANMRLGPHDFSSDSGAVKGGTTSICGYCHAVHIPAAEAMDNTPQWSRKSNVGGGSYGVYSSPTLNASVADVKSDVNYSLLCMSCHDGSSLFAINSYMTGKRPRTSTGATWDTTLTVDQQYNLYNGEFSLTHTHPINFTYDGTLATADGGLFPPVSNALAYDGGTGSKIRLFGGKMQCSTCHNVHMKSPIGTYMSSSGGKLCIACHNK